MNKKYGQGSWDQKTETENLRRFKNGRIEILKNKMKNVNPKDFEEMFIVGFRLNYRNEKPEIYTVVFYEETDKAVTQDDHLLFVTDISKIKSIYTGLDSEIMEKFPMPTEMETGIDVATTLYLLENEAKDEASTILDCLNIIFDLFNSIELPIPESRRKVLYELADFLTFADDFSDYLDKKSISRDEVIDHIVWCFGKLLTRSRIL